MAMEKRKIFEEQEIIFAKAKITIGQGKIMLASLDEPEKKTELSTSEYKLLWFFLKNYKQHLTKEQISHFLYDYQSYDYVDSIPVSVSRLRKKLGTVNPLLTEIIKTVRGTGSYYVEISEPKVVYKTSVHETKKEQYRIAKLKELKELGYTPLEIAKRLVKNDVELYGYAIGSYEEGTPQMWQAYLQGNPSSFQYLLDNNNDIVGNFSMVSIDKELQERLFSGKLKEGQMDITMTRSTHVPAKNHIFLLLNLSVNDDHRSTQTKMMLFEAFLKELLQLAKNGVFASHIINCVHLDHQVPFLKEFGFKKVVSDTDHYYQLNLQPFSKELKNSESLKDLIHQLYEEYRWI